MTDFRDGMNWGHVERQRGQHSFGGPRRNFPDVIADHGGTVSLVVNFGNPLYDDGNTPQERDALEALAAYAASLVDRFPNLTSIEIGNEFNGTNFVRGPLEHVTPQIRATAYTEMLKAGARGIRSVDPDMRILGGATHSLPGAWLWQILDEGGGDALDALAVHPYTTPAEQFVRQMTVLRRHPVLGALPVEVTEFGTHDQADAANHLLRNYCQFALGGVGRAVWFPASTRGPKMAPLFTDDGRISPAGRAWQLAHTRMAGRTVRNAAPDPFVYGCLFGEDTLVLWGEPRAASVSAGVRATDATGRALTAPYALSPTAPIVFSTMNGTAVSPLIRLEPGSRIADSYDQFQYPVGTEARADGDAFERFARRGTRELPLTTLPGQERPGTPWFPYRGNPDLRPMRLTAESLVPGMRSGEAVEIVHRYTAPEVQVLRLDARFEPSQRSEDGVFLSISINGAPILRRDLEPGRAATVNCNSLTLSPGDQLEIAVGPGENADGDVTDYRITLSKDKRSTCAIQRVHDFRGSVPSMFDYTVQPNPSPCVSQ